MQLRDVRRRPPTLEADWRNAERPNEKLSLEPGGVHDRLGGSSPTAAAATGTLAERVYWRLRHALLIGELSPGECVTLRNLARRLGTSVTPVRDALSRLIAAAALHQNRQSGLIVPVLSRAELEELFKLRMALEGFAFTNAVPQHRVIDWRGFKVLHADLRKAAECDDRPHFAAAVWSLRRAVLELDRWDILATLIDGIWCRLGPTFARQMSADIEKRRRISTHFGNIIAAIGCRDLDKAREALTNEISDGMTSLCNNLADELPAPPLVPLSVSLFREARSKSKSGAGHV